MCCEDGGFYVERMMEKDVYLGVIEGDIGMEDYVLMRKEE